MPDSVSIRYITLDILRDCHLTEPGYKRLVGSTGNSWGWCLKTMKVYHDSRKYRHGVPYPRDIDDKLRMPDTFYMILDMDRGTLAFQVCNDFLGVAFSGLRGEELFPIVSAVWGHCEVSWRFGFSSFINSCFVGNPDLCGKPPV